MGAVVPIAGSFAAGTEGAEWLLPGGARVAAKAGTEFRVVGKPQRLQLGPRRNTPGYTVILRSGELRVTVPRDGRSAVVVAAPKKANVLVIAGSTSIAATNERVSVANADGETSMGVGSDALRALRAGMLREVGQGAGADRPLAESPRSLDLPSLSFAYGADTSLGALSWPAAAGAGSYRVEIRNEKGRLVASRETRVAEVESGAFRLAPGKYVARVAGVDPSGLEAAQPVERTLRVVGVSVPERGFVDADGAVHFPAGRSVGLAHADGVEMTYGGGDHFVPAPRTLELVRAESRLIRFRLAGEASETKLWLVPRQVKARVEFGPKVPVWPKDSLEIRWRVEGLNGPRARAEALEIGPRGLIGVDPVHVAFVRDGNLLRGVLPPQTGTGPWVVRVEVQDQSGSELARDFIEIARR